VGEEEKKIGKILKNIEDKKSKDDILSRIPEKYRMSTSSENSLSLVNALSSSRNAITLR
jgi:pleiotropic regulator 1